MSDDKIKDGDICPGFGRYNPYTKKWEPIVYHDPYAGLDTSKIGLEPETFTPPGKDPAPPGYEWIEAPGDMSTGLLRKPDKKEWKLVPRRTHMDEKDVRMWKNQESSSLPTKPMDGLGKYDPYARTWSTPQTIDADVVHRMVRDAEDAKAAAEMNAQEKFARTLLMNKDASEVVRAFSNSVRVENMTYGSSTLNVLDREVGDHYFDADAFIQNPEAWNDCPIIFADQHPDLDLFTKDPATALKAVNGKIVGTVSGARIETTGRPRLMAALNIDDWQAQELHRIGKLSLSTAFFAKQKGGKLTGGIRPNHVLVFREDENNQPKDKGAMIANTEV